MMKYFILFLVIILLVKVQGQSIPCINWGLSIQSHLLLEKDAGTSIEFLPPPDFYLHIKPTFTNYLQADVYAGYIIFTSTWNGIDVGFNFRSRLNRRFDIIAGMDRLHVTGGLPGHSGYIYHVNTAFNFLNFGTDYYLSKKLYVEILYSAVVSRNKIFGYNNKSDKPMALRGKIDFGLGWDLTF